MRFLKEKIENPMRACAIIVTIFLLTLAISSTSSAFYPKPQIEFDGNSFTVKLGIDEASLNVIPEAKEYRVEIDKIPTQPRIGYPKVPKLQLFLAIPPSTYPEVESVNFEKKIDVGRFKITTVPKPLFDIERGMKVISGFSPYVATDFTASDVWPKNMVEVELVGYMRGLKVARVAIYPVRIDNVNGGVIFYPRISFKLSLKPTNDERTRVFSRSSNLGSSLLKSIVSNFEMAKNWLTKPVRSRDYINYEHMCKIEVEDEGLYALTKSDIFNSCGFPSDLDPRKLALFRSGEPVDILVTGEPDGQFNEGDLLIFWAEGYEDLYTRKNVYILALTNEFGPRMAHRPAAPSPETHQSGYFMKNISIKRDRFYFQQIPFSVEDHWFAEYMIAPTELTLEFELSEVDFSSGEQTRFFSSLFGASYPGDGTWDHHAVMYLNDTQVNELFWNGQQTAEGEAYVDTSLFFEGANWLEINLPFDTGCSLDVVCPDFFSISHPAKYEFSEGQIKIENPEGVEEGKLRFAVSDASAQDVVAFDITDPCHPVVLDDIAITPDRASYKVEFESDVSDDTVLALGVISSAPHPAVVKPLGGTWLYDYGGADYLIITHDALLDAADNLAEFHRERGVDVEGVSYSDLIDAFNYGFYGPIAIKNFLSFIYSNWSKVPTFVLLVGDASYDYKDNYGADGLDDFLSTLLVDDNVIGDTASDFLLACVDGDDFLPEFSIARLPAHTASEVSAYIDKLRRYYDSGDNFWRKDFLFVADDGFESSSEKTQEFVKSDYPIMELFISAYDDIDKLKKDLVDAMTKGAVWVDYAGHGGVDVWAHEHILDYQMIVNDIKNSGRYPFIVVWTCLNGYFDHALISEVIAEGFTLTRNAGAIGIFAPTRISLGLAGDLLAADLYSLVFENGERMLGTVATATQARAIDEGLGIWSESYLLFGDPMVELALPIPEDVNGSGRVDGVDLIYLCRHLDGSESDISKYADIDLDGTVTKDDFNLLANAFGTHTF